MMKKQRRENFEGFLFIGAGLLLFCVFILYPQLKNIYIAFSEYSIIPGAENKFVGLKNFKDMLFSSGTYGNSDSFYVALKNSILAVIVTVPGQLILGVRFCCKVFKRIYFKLKL